MVWEPPAALAQPSVWLLLDDRPGHATQVRGLARRLGWSAIEKPMRFNWLNRLPNPLLGASLVSTTGASLQAPFPDLAIGMGRRILPVARWIKARSGGRTRIVMLGRKAVDGGAGVDLHIACHHFHLLANPKLFELSVPPCQVDAQSLAAARSARLNPMQGMKRPNVVLLAGGPTAQHHFTPEFAGMMAARAQGATSRLGGSLAIVTSRRTPEACIAAMRAAAPSAHLHEWRADRADNPYVSYLAHADHLVVTGESESMLAEAVAASLPVTIYPLEPRPPAMSARWAWKLRRAAGLKPGLARWLVGNGWVPVPRDLALMHERLCSQGLARMFDGTVNTAAPRATDELVALTQRIRALLPGDHDRVA